jgi:hypothetical protein
MEFLEYNQAACGTEVMAIINPYQVWRNRLVPLLQCQCAYLRNSREIFRRLAKAQFQMLA